MVAAGKATLEEVESYYSLTDVWRLNDVLDALEDAQAEAMKVKP